MKRLLLVFIILSAMLSCNNRTDPVSSRDNPYDSGSDAFSINTAPELQVQIDSSWDDFDHTSNTGSIRLRYSTTDLNQPRDTLTTHFFVGTSSSSMNEITPENDSTCTITGLKPGVTYRCSCIVDDYYNGHDTVLLSIKTRVLIPPRAPVPSLVLSVTSATISWKAVAGATGYILYKSDSYTGPFGIDSVIAQPAAGQGTPVNIKLPLEASASPFYIVASFNQAGESKSADTLFARLYFPQITIPVIDSISKGTHDDYISIAWHDTSRTIEKFELYRSLSKEGPYQPFATAPGGTGEHFYHDSVKTSLTYYYRIAALDNSGKSSNLSESNFGYIYRLMEATALSVDATSKHIMLSWNNVPEAFAYAVYRSEISCSTAPKKIATRITLNYFDTVPTTATYYYTVAVIDGNHNEGPKSNCVSGRLGLLPAPQGFQVLNNVAPNTITLRWDATPGAVSYVVYRSVIGCPDSTDLFGTPVTTSFSDTNITGTTVYYYSVAALDKGGRKGAMCTCSKGSANLLPSPTGLSVSYGTVTDAIVITWNKLAKAKSYRIYRSAESCSDTMPKLATASQPAYIDSVTTTGIFYYKVAGVDSAGIEGSSSACWEGRVKLLLPPSNLQASRGTYPNGISVTWNSVSDAKGYIVYRGTSSSFTRAQPVDTVTKPPYFDSVTTTATQYYWVAALGRTGAGTRSAVTYGYIAAPPHLLVSRYTSSIVLSWKSTLTGVMTYIMRGTDTLKMAIKDSTTGVSYTDVPVDFEDYYYRVMVKSTSGVVIPSNIVIGHRILSAPTGLKATDKLTGVLLQWDRTPGVKKYALSRSTSSSGTTIYKEVSDTFYFDTLSTATRYYYRVAGASINQTSSMSGYVIGGALQPPAAPISVRISSVLDTIYLFWTASSGGSTPDGFIIYRSTSYSGVYAPIDSTTEQNYGDAVTDTGMFYYRIAAYNASGVGTKSTTVYSKLLPPAAPAQVTATQSSYVTHVRVSWRSVAKATGYNIYRSTSTGSSSFQKLATTTDTTFNDSSAAVNTRYYYRITTLVGKHEGTLSSYYAGMRLGPPATVSLSTSINGIYITWSANPYTVSTYYIYRAGTSTGPFVKIDSVATTRYLDTNDAAGNNYYRISAKNIQESPQSTIAGPVHRDFPAAPGTITTSAGTDSGGIRILWNRVSGASGYRIYRSMSDSFTTSTALLATTDTSFYFDSVPSDSFYYYKVKAFNQGGESSMSSSTGRGFRKPSVVPLPVTTLDTIDLSSSGGISLVWTVSSQTIAFTGFKVYRAETEDGTYQVIDETTAKTFFDEPPSSFPEVYWYKVSAFNQKGESALSDAVSGTRR